MDKKKSLTNIIVSLVFKVVLVALVLLNRRFLISYVGNTATGVLSLYTSIIGFLSIAELGIGTAITFSMYKPIVEDDIPTVSSLYRLFVKFYRVVGIIILVVGLCITPFLPLLAREHGSINLYHTFIIMLISIIVNYTYSAKTSVINAYKNNYITTIIHSFGLIFQYILQIILLYFFKSFELYLYSMIFASILQWILTNIYFKKEHNILTKFNNSLDKQLKKDVISKTKAMFFHKIGGFLVTSTDSILISMFVGLVLLGKYTNYLTILDSMNSVLIVFFVPLTGIIGHLCVKESKNTQIHYFNFFYGFNYVLGTFFCFGYYAVINDFILIFFGNNLILSNVIVYVVTLNFFIRFIRNCNWIFKDATGTFYNDRYKPLIEGAVNLILSLVLGYFWGIVGIVLATIITNLFINHIVEPFVLYKYAFNSSAKNFIIKNYLFIGLFSVILMIIPYININFENVLVSFVVNGIIACSISLLPITLMYIFNVDFRKETHNIIQRILNKIFRLSFKS